MFNTNNFCTPVSPKIVPPFQLANIGKDTKIRCISNKSISWLFNGDAYFAKNVEFSGHKNGTLIIVKTKRDNSGTYSCVTKDAGDKEYIINSEVLDTCNYPLTESSNAARNVLSNNNGVISVVYKFIG